MTLALQLRTIIHQKRSCSNRVSGSSQQDQYVNQQKEVVDIGQPPGLFRTEYNLQIAPEPSLCFPASCL